MTPVMPVMPVTPMTTITPAESRLGAPGWREFFDLLSDAVVVFDRSASIVLANTAALRLLPCEAGMSPDHLQAALGRDAVQWLHRAMAGSAGGASTLRVLLGIGRNAQLTWRRLDGQHGALHLVPDAVSSAATLPPSSHETSRTVYPGHSTRTNSATHPTQLASGRQAAGLRDAAGVFWDSPFPASFQGPDFRLIDVNQAFVEFTGYSRAQLIGLDVKKLHLPEDWPAVMARREQLKRSFGQADAGDLIDGRMIDASGRERRYRAARRTLVSTDGQVRYLSVLQDATAEHVAREHADRSMRELDHWFDLSPTGMVLFDDSGLLLQANPAFLELVGAVPVSLTDGPPGLRDLLLWGDSTELAQLQAGAMTAHGQAWITPPGEATRALRSTVRCYITAAGRRRYMAVVEDRSVEEERDLAQMQIGALMDTAGVGLATFQESSGWVRQRHAAPGRASSASGSASTAALQTISRDIVTPETLPEYEKLQLALRHARRAEVRYAISHPDLGQRWLLTRVEPATLSSGKRTTSVVTLDITQQHESQQRSDQLLREMSTILESATAGIAYLRGNALVRCNRRFEAMLGLPAGTVAGSDLQSLFGTYEATDRIAADAWQALREGTVYETEFDVPVKVGGVPMTRWYSLSVRRTGLVSAKIEAIAVLTDVTRLKKQQTELEILARDRELMFSLSGVGIAFIRGSRIQRANEALAQLAGCTVEHLSTLELADLFSDQAEFARRWPQVERDLRLHGRWTGERQMRVRDGRLRWVQVSKRLVTAGDASGGIIASYVNVNARHRAERTVTLQAERTRSILDSVLVGIVTVGDQGIEWMNRSARRMFGGSLADFTNLPIATVATPEADHPFRRTDYLTELIEGRAETFECRVQARDGRQFWIVGNVVSTARESTGRQLTYALLDMERRREAEARMSQVQVSLQRIIEAAPLSITLRDARTLRILQANEVAANNVHIPRAALIGRSPEEIFDPETAAHRRRDMEVALASRDVTKREYHTLQNGETRLWDTRYLPLSAGEGLEPDQLLMVATDVTEQRAAQEARFDAAIAQRDMLVKEVHHRIKNNLQGVAGLLQQIAQRKPEVASAIAEVVGQVQAIAQVYGLQVGTGGPLNLMNVVEAITVSVQRTFGRSIRFEVRGAQPQDWALPEAESIPVALTINELLTNAVKHSQNAPQAQVLCTLESGDTGVRVLVANIATLPAGFNVAGIPSGVSGLGLVRALLPRRSASLTLEQLGAQVVATVHLNPPAVVRVDAAAAP